MQLAKVLEPSPRLPSALVPACALGVALQLALLLGHDPDRGARAVLMVTAVVALPLWVGRKHLSHAACAMAATGALGGLGMLAGSLLDQHWGTRAMPPCHFRMAPITFASLLTWMNGLMLLACVPACLWLTPACPTRHVTGLRHALCAVTMFLGMLFGGRWLAPYLDGTLSALAANHVAMLIGMTLGAALAHVSPSRTERSLEISGPTSAQPVRSRRGRVRAISTRSRP